MKTPLIPEDEASRLRSLYELNILDSARENAYDRITRTAARLFDVPIALVSLVDADRQWFKSRCGVDTCETHRDISFCGHTILSQEPLVVRDASLDQRFHDNPLVTGEPGIRFYAGHPVQTPDGSRIGTLCLIDREARDFGEQDLLALADLAGIIESELNMRVQTTRDDLTGICNRRGFNCLAGKYLNASARSSLPMSLIYLDLDEFKTINDSFGHAAGDLALQLFASALEESFRDADVVARLGGDEFVALMWNAKPAYAEVALGRLRDTLDEATHHLEEGFDIKFSAGVIPVKQGHHRHIDRLLESADQQMYLEKRQRLSGESLASRLASV